MDEFDLEGVFDEDDYQSVGQAKGKATFALPQPRCAPARSVRASSRSSRAGQTPKLTA
jgi:hypothetical protein